MTGDEVKVARIEEAADIAVGSATIAQAAAKKVLDNLPPPPDPRDVNYRRLANAEQGWLARINPRRNRWPALVEVQCPGIAVSRRKFGGHTRNFATAADRSKYR